MFDTQGEEREERVVGAYGRVLHTDAIRDSVRMKGFIGPFSKVERYRDFDKGHFVAHKINILWGKGYKYYQEQLDGFLVSQKSSKTTPIQVLSRLVCNYQESPILKYYPNREAFIGRNILNQNQLVIIIDTK